MDRPNLLFLFTDEQRWDTLAAYGNEQIEMPHLNRLASQSTVFRHCICTQPVCTPSRGSIMTGLYPHKHGAVANNVPLNANARCLPELMTSEARTAYFGKWHLGDEIYPQHGFQEWHGIEDHYRPFYSEGRDRNDRSPYHHWLVEQGVSPADGEEFDRGEAARLPEPQGKPAFLSERVSAFLRENRNERFVAYVNFLEPHMPFFGPRDDQYDPAEIALPETYYSDIPEDHHPRGRMVREQFTRTGSDGYPLQSEEDWKALKARYFGLNSLVDTHVGRILQTLEECGLDENTIVVFTSDHGDMMGDHRLYAKTFMYQPSIRVPLLLRMPGQTRQDFYESPFSQIDLVPTLLQALGEEVPDGLHGASRLPALTGHANEPTDGAVTIWDGLGSGAKANLGTMPDWMSEFTGHDPDLAQRILEDPIRTIVRPDGWRFSYSANGWHELFDLNADPLETTNRIQDPDCRPIITDSLDRIEAWQRRVEDTLSIDRSNLG